MTIRFGNSGDFHALVPVMRQCRQRRQELDRLYQLRPNADERFRRWIGDLAGDPRSMMLVAEGNGRILGFLIATIEKGPPIYADEEFGLVREWWVDPAFQGDATAAKLIDRATEEFAKHGVRQFRVSTPEGEGETSEQFKRLGFRTISHEMVLESPNPGGRRKRTRTGTSRQNISDPKTPM